jgi:hypothetical protein
VPEACCYIEFHTNSFLRLSCVMVSFEVSYVVLFGTEIAGEWMCVSHLRKINERTVIKITHGHEFLSEREETTKTMTFLPENIEKRRTGENRSNLKKSTVLLSKNVSAEARLWGTRCI